MSSNLVNPESLMGTTDYSIPPDENLSISKALPELNPSRSMFSPLRNIPGTGSMINRLIYNASKESTRYQDQSYTVNNIYTSLSDDNYLTDESLRALRGTMNPPDSSLLSTILDPSPFTPGHENAIQTQSLLEGERIQSLLQKEGNPYITCATSPMYSQLSENQQTLKRNQDFYLKSLITPNFFTTINHNGATATLPNSTTNFNTNSSNDNYLWNRPAKRMKINVNESVQPVVQEPVSESKPVKTDPVATAKHSPIMAMKCDRDYLSEYQCLVREQIEIFEACKEEVESRDRGRNSAIVLGQVGIRCKYCARLPARLRPRGASYYTSTLSGLYQAAQKMTTDHLFKHCSLIPASIKTSLFVLKQDRKRASDGKRYWAEGARSLGIRETRQSGLRLARKSGGEGTNKAKDDAIT